MSERTWTLSSGRDAVVTGAGEIAGYMALWAHTAYAVQIEMEMDHGMNWPIGRSYSASYTLVFDDNPRQRITIDADPGEVFVVAMWVFGTEGGQEDFHVRRSLSNPRRDRLEGFVRAYLRVGNVDAALKELSVDYMRAIQDREP